jgi:hypothetical protein
MRQFRLVFYSAAAVLLLALISLAHSWARVDTKANSMAAARNPVLVELFTSEGCSDCPPADALLEQLDRSQPVDGAELIVLSEHVDYWNHLGWKDPYSSHASSERQSAYSELFKLDSVYTPQMVIDGKVQLVGSDKRGALEAAANAAKGEKTQVSITAVSMEANHVLALHIEVGRLPRGAVNSAKVLLAIADERDESHVATGENGGRTLRHIAVVRSLSQVGVLSGTDELSRDVKINIAAKPGATRVVAFVQEEKTGIVWGAGSARL